MIESNSVEWNKETLRTLRLRMGWCKSDLARRLQCTSRDVEMWEQGAESIRASLIGELELILRQAEACSEEVKFTPAAEQQCEKDALSQITFSRVKADLE